MKILTILASLYNAISRYFYRKKVDAAVTKLQATTTDKDEADALTELSQAVYSDSGTPKPSAPSSPAESTATGQSEANPETPAPSPNHPGPERVL